MSKLKTKIIPIGNSQGIRIPKSVIKQCHLQDEVELEPKGNCLIIKSKANPREGWDKAFRDMAKKGDDKLIYGNSILETDWDKAEWEW